jgi:restriction system protein
MCEKYRTLSKARLALNALAESVTLTEYEKGYYESGGLRFDHIVRFATVDTVRAGWLIKQKGIWTLTEEGDKALKNYPDPPQFHRQAAYLYRLWQKENKAAQALVTVDVSGDIPDGESVDDSGKDVGVTFEQAEEQAWGAIEQHLQNMLPYEVQDLVADLLRAMGYFVVWVSPPGKDAGVDVIATAIL